MPVHHTPDQWVSRSAFQRLDPTTQAGQFGSEGRNVVRGPGIANVDLALVKNFALGESRRLQFRAESFNVANHAQLLSSGGRHRVPELRAGFASGFAAAASTRTQIRFLVL